MKIFCVENGLARVIYVFFLRRPNIICIADIVVVPGGVLHSLFHN